MMSEVTFQCSMTFARSIFLEKFQNLTTFDFFKCFQRQFCHLLFIHKTKLELTLCSIFKIGGDMETLKERYGKDKEQRSLRKF